MYGTVIFIRNIKEGKKEPFNRPYFRVWCGKIQASAFYQWNDTYNFALMGERVQLKNHDPFPWELEFRGPGPKNELVFSTVLEKNEAVVKPGEVNQEVTAWNKHTEHFSSQCNFGNTGKLQQTGSIKERGVYAVTCKRHASVKSYLFMLENPYVGVGNPSFLIDTVPPGKYTVEVWHPAFEPLKREHEVTIKENETVELAVEFKVP